MTRLVLRGDPARGIVETARGKNVDLMVMSTLGEGPFFRLLLDSVTAQILHESGCPAGKGAGTRVLDPPRPLLDGSGPHNRHTALRAVEMAAAVDAKLTVVLRILGIPGRAPPSGRSVSVEASSRSPTLIALSAAKAAVLIEWQLPKCLRG